LGNDYMTASPSGTFRTGKGLLNIAANQQQQFETLCRLIGRPELVSDQRFATEAARRANHDAIDEIITAWTKGITKIEAMERLQAAGVPAGAVLDGRDLHFDPQLKARGLLEMVNFPKEREMGSRRPIIGRPWRFSKVPAQVRGPAPTFGQHNREILSEVLGYDESRREALESAGIVAGKPVKPRPVLDMSMDERIELGRLAYWDRDYKKRLGID
jgi:crotonobetainyl-CoA:carnitine CoA-transferase CaiB-like acyl-CoA transferase